MTPGLTFIRDDRQNKVGVLPLLLEKIRLSNGTIYLSTSNTGKIYFTFKPKSK